MPFEEDEWVGGVLTFDEGGSPAIAVTMRDIRCAVVNYDPDDGSTAAEMLKAVVRIHDNTAGVYGTVMRVGRLAVGQTVTLHLEQLKAVSPARSETEGSTRWLAD